MIKCDLKRVFCIVFLRRLPTDAEEIMLVAQGHAALFQSCVFSLEMLPMPSFNEWHMLGLKQQLCWLSTSQWQHLWQWQRKRESWQKMIAQIDDKFPDRPMHMTTDWINQQWCEFNDNQCLLVLWQQHHLVLLLSLWQQLRTIACWHEMATTKIAFVLILHHVFTRVLTFCMLMCAGGHVLHWHCL